MQIKDKLKERLGIALKCDESCLTIITYVGSGYRTTENCWNPTRETNEELEDEELEEILKYLKELKDANRLRFGTEIRSGGGIIIYVHLTENQVGYWNSMETKLAAFNMKMELIRLLETKEV